MFVGGGICGGAGGIRTPDLFNAIEALSQLSYSPRVMFFSLRAGVMYKERLIQSACIHLCVFNFNGKDWVLRCFQVL